MPEPRTCHLPTKTALVCIGIEAFDADIAISNINELGGRQ